MNVLVTGANGQLGREMRNVSANGKHKYIFTDVTDAEGLETVYLDASDQAAVMKFVTDEHIAVIVNCAAYTNVDKAEMDYTNANLLNNKLPGYLAEAARATGAVLIHISTDYVFKGDLFEPLTESCATNPSGVYGITKLMGEKSIQLSGCKYMIFRTSWLYSPYGANFVKTMRRLTAEKDTLNVVFDQIGTPTFARDLAKVIVHVIETEQLDKLGLYHFSNEGVCSWYDFAKDICFLTGNDCDIRPCHTWEYPTKVRRPAFSVLDKTKVKKTFGISIPYWRDSLMQCIEELDR